MVRVTILQHSCNQGKSSHFGILSFLNAIIRSLVHRALDFVVSLGEDWADRDGLTLTF